ncbi:MAG: hypothetical protein J7K21_01055 [Desulfurococcales archaeon]|nr:hypothetical protein [Desulfurococcales archaeon]
MRVDQWVKSLLSGCGKESEMLELISILHQASEEYFSGRMSNEDLVGLAQKLCESIVVLANECGKPLDMDKCVNDLVSSVKSTIPRGSLRDLLTRMRKGKGRTTSTSETGLL